ncbi:SP_1767 family glycosyltransferase [Bacillus sp. XF8]|uniref:SP_1767 family glycosyltransferase n=1 Tax=Bacillus sp. XF8 TaxID=2819289 RepID=UPI001AA0A22A|nr:SP_1767 family glycosyltransferase [Bacillus sp. XF8]MBO1579743.1 SP_1767 family glycosyltransferase [Bacillus sp. XF8]
MRQIKVKNILVFMWNKLVDVKIQGLNRLTIIKDRFMKYFLKPPAIQSIDDTLTKIIRDKASVARYGDGEFKLIHNRDITFQRADHLLSKRLKEILLSEDDNFLVCLPDVFQELSIYADEPKNYWRLHTAKYRLEWYKDLKKGKVYYNSFISRFYYPFRDKSKCKEWFTLLKLIWKDRDIVVIEGNKSRLGIGNDLFDNAKSIERILVPEEHAFLHYDKILTAAKKNNKSKLILLAIGPTATILAYDLYKEGYQTIDIGHVDIEYEWFLRQAKTKIKIENKYVCEAGAGQNVGDIQDKKYLSEIKAVIR